MIRSLFLPEEGCKWGCFDYSQQEPRLVVHYAMLSKMYGVNEVAEAYHEGDADFHDIVSQMAEIPRKQAKTINLGLFYGMGKNKLQAELGVSKDRADDLFKKYIQGSAADMTKKAMLDLFKAGIIPHIQVHDELDISVKDDKEAKNIIEIMENAVELEVPNKVDYESGENWGDIK